MKRDLRCWNALPTNRGQRNAYSPDPQNGLYFFDTAPPSPCPQGKGKNCKACLGTGLIHKGYVGRRNPEERNRLVEENIRLAYAFGSTYFVRHPWTHIGEECDCQAVAAQGLLRAAELYPTSVLSCGPCLTIGEGSSKSWPSRTVPLPMSGRDALLLRSTEVGIDLLRGQDSARACP